MKKEWFDSVSVPLHVLDQSKMSSNEPKKCWTIWFKDNIWQPSISSIQIQLSLSNSRYRSSCVEFDDFFTVFFCFYRIYRAIHRKKRGDRLKFKWWILRQGVHLSLRVYCSFFSVHHLLLRFFRFRFFSLSLSLSLSKNKANARRKEKVVPGCFLS